MTESPGLSVVAHSEADLVPPSTISVRDVAMRFPIAKRYRELALHPFRAAARLYRVVRRQH